MKAKYVLLLLILLGVFTLSSTSSTYGASTVLKVKAKGGASTVLEVKAKGGASTVLEVKAKGGKIHKLLPLEGIPPFPDVEEFRSSHIELMIIETETPGEASGWAEFEVEALVRVDGEIWEVEVKTEMAIEGYDVQPDGSKKYTGTARYKAKIQTIYPYDEPFRWVGGPCSMWVHIQGTKPSELVNIAAGTGGLDTDDVFRVHNLVLYKYKVDD